MKRIFIIGCSRSGTTLLQSMLVGHPDLCSWPETHVFKLGIGRRGRELFAPFLRKKLIDNLSNDLQITGKNLSSKKITLPFITVNNFTHKVISILDNSAKEQGYAGWIEKTPEHIFYINEIQKQMPNTKFIHLVRDGRHVVASIVYMWSLYTREWPKWRTLLMSLNDMRYVYLLVNDLLKGENGEYSFQLFYELRRFARAIKIWNDSILETIKYVNNSNHFICFYNNLINNVESTLRNISDFLEIDFSSKMLSYRNEIGNLVRLDEPWKATNFEEINPKTSNRFDVLPKEYKLFISRMLYGSGDINKIFANTTYLKYENSKIETII